LVQHITILTQDTEKGEKVISCSSRILKGAEKNSLTKEKECLAIVWVIQKLNIQIYTASSWSHKTETRIAPTVNRKNKKGS